MAEELGIELDKYDDGKKVRIKGGSISTENKVRPEELLGAQFGGNRQRDSELNALHQMPAPVPI